MKLDQSNVAFIVIHCSATRSNQSYSPEQMRHDHLQRGFAGCGYHFYVRRSGEIVEMRPTTEAGAHVRGYNRCSIGVCYEGGLDADGQPCDTRTAYQKDALACVVEVLRERYPKAEVVGHRDLSPDLNGDGVVEPCEWIKLCPCFDAKLEYCSKKGGGC